MWTTESSRLLSTLFILTPSIGLHRLHSLAEHMGAEPENSFKGVAKGPLYGKLTTRHHRLSYYVSPNQSCKVFGDFGQKS